MTVFRCHIYLKPFGVIFECSGVFLSILYHLCTYFAVYWHEKWQCKICFVLLVYNYPSTFGLLVWTAMPLRKSFEAASDSCGTAENTVFNRIFSLLTYFVLIRENVLNYLCLIKLLYVKSKQLSLFAHGRLEFLRWAPAFFFAFLRHSFFLYILFEFYAIVLWVQVFSWCPGMRVIYLNIFSNL